MARPKEVPTVQQLGVPAGRLFRRAFALRCPACGGRHFVRRWIGLVERCPTCSLLVERIEGHSLGYIGLNTVISFSTLFWIVLGMSLAMRPNIDVARMLEVCVTTAVVMPILIAPFCRTLWTAADLVVRPLKPGEIDPAFVVTAPASGSPSGS